jgi:hypothetical protein
MWESQGLAREKGGEEDDAHFGPVTHRARHSLIFLALKKLEYR